MLLFCPTCSNTLLCTPLQPHELASSSAMQPGTHRFTCRTCPYQRLLTYDWYDRQSDFFKGKDGGGEPRSEEVLGGEGSWRNVDKTEVNCTNPSCGSKSAYFRQVQIRSADEPMTSFYKCVECGNEWRE